MEVKEERSIEESFDMLDELIERLESGEESLEESFRNYEEGMKLIKNCNKKIEKIEKQILILSGESEDGENDSHI